jgi:CDP-diacylglycerol--serine O-phosphatidyltransferase
VNPVRKIAIIPTLLTLGNAVCGFAAIAYASKITPDAEQYFAISGWLIISAMLFDALDGHVARLSKSASKFGAELDSLCDAISFGLAPAFIVMRMGPGWEPHQSLHQFLAGIATLYMVCTLLRLARFNVESTVDPGSSKVFRGLPSPGAAGCLASLAILRGALPQFTTLDPSFVRGLTEVWATLGALILALLMVSRVPYPHATKQFLNQSLRGRRHLSHLVQLLLLAFVIVMIRELAILVGFWLYALGFPLRSMILRAMRPKALPSTPRGDELLPH